MVQGTAGIAGRGKVVSPGDRAGPDGEPAGPGGDEGMDAHGGQPGADPMDVPRRQLDEPRRQADAGNRDRNGLPTGGAVETERGECGRTARPEVERAVQP